MGESLTFSALERMQRMKKGSAFPSASRSLFREVWGGGEGVELGPPRGHIPQGKGVQVTFLHQRGCICAEREQGRPQREAVPPRKAAKGAVGPRGPGPPCFYIRFKGRGRWWNQINSF